MILHIWQLTPEYANWHTQVYAVIEGIHTAPFKHGLLWHGFESKITIFKIEIFFL